MDESSKEIHSEGQFESLVNEFSEICQDNNILPNEELPIKEDKSELSNQFDIKDQAYEMVDENDESHDHARTIIDDSVGCKGENDESEDRKLGVIFASYEHVTGVQVACKKLSAYDIWRINSELSVSGHQCATCGQIFRTNCALKQHNKYPCIDDDKPLLYEEVEHLKPSNNTLIQNVVNCSDNLGRNWNTYVTSSTTLDLNNIYDGNNDRQVSQRLLKKIPTSKMGTNRKNINYKIRIPPVNRSTLSHPGETFFCHICNYSFSEKKKLSAHILRLHLKNGSRMNICSTLRNLNHSPCLELENSFSSDNPMKNVVSKLAARSRRIKVSRHLTRPISNLSTSLVDVNSEQKRELHKCPICDNLYSSLVLLHEHKQTHTAEEEEKIERCEICSARFYTSDELKTHVNEVHLKFKCELCEKSYPSEGNLFFHLKFAHKLDLPFKCNECGKGFSTRKILASHTYSSKCFACGKCSKMTNDACFIHGKYMCDCCKKLFPHKSLLCSHMRKHLPKNCPHCPKMFVETRKLKNHIRQHTNEKARRDAEMYRIGKMPVDPIKPIIKPGEKINDKVPTSIVTSAVLRRAFFKCEVCGSLFSTVTLLNRHTASHTVQSTE